MTRLWLHPDQATTLVEYARLARPQEACGLLVGRGERVEAIIPIQNSAADPAHNYRLNEDAYIRALFQAQRGGQSLLAFYHSHPASAPIPSSEDIRQATYPHTPYLIIGFPGSQAALAAWLLRPDQVERVDLHIGVRPPKPAEPGLSAAQKTAVALAALLAFAFFILLSLSLLPPAPILVAPLP